MSVDLFHWTRIGLARFAPYDGIDFVRVDNPAVRADTRRLLRGYRCAL